MGENMSDSVRNIVVTVIIGLVAGFLASLVVGSSGGLLGLIIAGVLGAFVGTYVLGALGINLGIRDPLVSLIVTSTIGAIIVLFIARVIA